MTSQYFGFDDDETVEVLNTNGNLAAGKNMASKPPSPVKIPISEIQALLSQDLTSNDSTKNSTLNESSFYAEEDTSISQSHLDCTIEESFPMNQSLNSSHTVNGKTRQITRGEKRARKVLGAIENKGSENTSTPMKIYKKPATSSASKNKENSSAKKTKENSKTKKLKLSKKDIADENYEKLAEQIQKRFEEIENFELVVE